MVLFASGCVSRRGIPIVDTQAVGDESRLVDIAVTVGDGL